MKAASVVAGKEIGLGDKQVVEVVPPSPGVPLAAQ
jgi:hypothetical protein